MTSKTRRKAIAKVDARTAKFNDWFTAQFGFSPHGHDIQGLHANLMAAQRALEWAENQYNAAVHQEAIADAALKAWQASRTQGGGK